MGQSNLRRAIALIGADGWLHGVHTELSPSAPCYAAGGGDWPATQHPRPRGVYDTDIGRIAVCASSPDSEALACLAAMGAELIIVPPDEDVALLRMSEGQRRATVALHDPTTEPPHSSFTRYAACGPEPLLCGSEPGAMRHPTVVCVKGGVLSAEMIAAPAAGKPLPL